MNGKENDQVDKTPKDPLLIKYVATRQEKTVGLEHLLACRKSAVVPFKSVIPLLAQELVQNKGAIGPRQRIPPINPRVVVGYGVGGDDEATEQHEK